jgi:hypothetical protein
MRGAACVKARPVAARVKSVVKIILNIEVCSRNVALLSGVDEYDDNRWGRLGDLYFRGKMPLIL